MNGSKICTAEFSASSVQYDGCFSDATTGKNMDTYKGVLGSEYGLIQRVYDATRLPLATRIEQRGYFLSDYVAREEQNRTFKSKLTANISQYITSKYCATEISTSYGTDALVISQNTKDGAIIKKTPDYCDSIPAGAPLSSEYYYYENTGDEILFTL